MKVLHYIIFPYKGVLLIFSWCPYFPQAFRVDGSISEDAGVTVKYMYILIFTTSSFLFGLFFKFIFPAVISLLCIH